jgi:hypothetical protein
MTVLPQDAARSRRAPSLPEQPGGQEAKGRDFHEPPRPGTIAAEGHGQPGDENEQSKE